MEQVTLTPLIKYELRDYTPADARHINELALAAFEQYKCHYDNWEAFSANVAKFSDLAEVAEIVVAEDCAREIIGVVAYVPASIIKAEYFPENTPVIRVLAVSPKARGLGLGKALSNECIRRAIRDGNSRIALHTSTIMEIALPMYLRMGFQWYGDATPLFGVEYSVYVKSLNNAIALYTE